MKSKGSKTQESQYQILLELAENEGHNVLGLMSNQVWHDDPKRLVFVLSRYKFVAKMLAEYENVLEVGCGDGWASRIVQQSVKCLTLSDFDPIFVNDVRERANIKWPVKAIVHDMVKEPATEKYDAIYAIDVFEHIHPSSENAFLRNISDSLYESGTAILGIPSIESQEYASPVSKQGHVNCKTGSELRTILKKYFENVFMFSMNDEVVHTGFDKMANYLFGLCCGPKNLD